MSLPPTLSKVAVGAYVRAYDVNIAEAAPLNGEGAYPTFDAFFTRPLRAGARSWEGPEDVLGSPVDGRLVSTGSIDDDQIVVKGRPYAAAELLLSDTAMAQHRAGSFAVIYLSPRDYHRVHAPLRCRCVEVRSREGDLFPVNSVSERHIPNYLILNRRVAIELQSDPHGTITVVMVAAMIVGRITVEGVAGRDVPFGTHRIDPARTLERGAELGAFHLGSTVVLFNEPGARPFDRALGPVRLGNPLSNSGSRVQTARPDGDGLGQVGDG